MTKLTNRQIELLEELYCQRGTVLHPGGMVIYGDGREESYEGTGPGWVTPMWVGGSDASYHSAVLAQLCWKGLAERQRRGWRTASFLYRITTAGLTVLGK